MTTSTAEFQLYIDGRWIESGAWHDVASPYSGEVVGRVPWVGADHTRSALDGAERAMLAPMPQHERAAILERMALLIGERSKLLAETICAEAAKPISIARVEVERAIGTFSAAANVARTLTGEVVAMDGWTSGSGHMAYTQSIPIGIVGAITPFNFPLNLVAHKVAPAIAAGCAIVHKPAEKTPLTAIHLARIAEDAGLPAGWLNVVVGPASDIAAVLCEDPRVGLITFTGSSVVGFKLRQQSQFAKVTLELGNSTPVIVCNDANVEYTLDTIMPGTFGFSGQTCVSTQRIYVHDSLFDEFRDALLKRVAELCVGDPALSDTVVGPVITAEAHARLLAWITEATSAGAMLLAGGKDIGNNVIEPTVLTDVPVATQLGCQEAFGPLVVVEPYSELNSAFELANGTVYGLQAAIFTDSLDIAQRASRSLHFGSVLVNESPSFRADHMPYGGTKQSGNTKEGPMFAVREMTESKLVVFKLGANNARS